MPVTEAARRMKQIRQLALDHGLVILTSHDKPALIVMEVERGQRLLNGAEQLLNLLAATSVIEVVQAISRLYAIEFGGDQEWIRQTLAEMNRADPLQTRIQTIVRSPTRSVRSP
jgi:hypothetical protein